MLQIETESRLECVTLGQQTVRELRPHGGYQFPALRCIVRWHQLHEFDST